MGYVKVKAVIWNIDNPGNSREVEAMVDTGSIYTVMPKSLLESLGVKPMGRRRFRLADNSIIERDIGIVGIEIKGYRAYTIVVFGDEGVYLIGVTTLEELALEVDPATGELRPMKELLLM